MLIEIGIAVLLDWLIGDPPNWPHPIRFIGWLIKTFESLIRKVFGKRDENLYAGGLLLLLLTVFTMVGTYEIIRLISHPILLKIINIYLLYTFLACKCLKDEAVKVKRLLLEGNLEKSRKELGYLVGRDTETLDETQILRGILETVSENTVDGVLAPLFYMLVGVVFHQAVVFALIYKVVNTLDSMVGYKQPPYKEIGFFSAKCDDVLNFIPARIGALIMLLAGGILGFDIKRGFQMVKRDHANHKSPNCGYPEAASAGLMGIQLGGTNVYFGETVYKPTIGDACKAFEIADIDSSVKIMYLSEVLLAGIGVGILMGLI